MPPRAPSPSNDAAILRLLVSHHARYPLWRIEDIYKLIFQGTFGSEHGVPDPASARARLFEELARLPDGPAEPLFDPISVDGRIARVHLRPFAARQGNPDALCAAFIRTAKEHRGAPADLMAAWETLETAAQGGRLPFASSAVRRFRAEHFEGGFPAVRHSPVYVRAYGPAYRVIRLDDLAGVSDLEGPQASDRGPESSTG